MLEVNSEYFIYLHSFFKNFNATTLYMYQLILYLVNVWLEPHINVAPYGSFMTPVCEANMLISIT